MPTCISKANEIETTLGLHSIYLSSRLYILRTTWQVISFHELQIITINIAVEYTSERPATSVFLDSYPRIAADPFFHI